MPKLKPLSIEMLQREASSFAKAQSKHAEPSLFGVTDGKAVGTYLEHKFQTHLHSRYIYGRGNSAKGIDFPELGVDIKVTDTLDKRDYHISSEKIIKVLSYKPVSSIRQEVANLRKALDGGQFKEIDAAEHYNMKFMKVARSAKAYDFASR